jgi:hypothetical protein
VRRPVSYEDSILALFVPLADGIQAELVYRFAGKIITNRLWFVVVAGGPTTADLIAVGAGVGAWARDNLMLCLSQDLRLLEVRTYDATVPYPGPQVITFVGADGGQAEKSYSANVAVKMEFQTQTPPALWLNWNFIPGIPDSAVLLNTIQPSFITCVQNSYITLLDVFSLFTYRWVATRAIVDGIPLATRDQFRIDHPRIRRHVVSQRRTRLP